MNDQECLELRDRIIRLETKMEGIENFNLQQFAYNDKLDTRLRSIESKVSGIRVLLSLNIAGIIGLMVALVGILLRG